MRKKILAMIMAIVFIMPGCQKAPENAIVKNKNLDDMIKEAKETGNKDNNPEQMAEKYDSYKTDFTNKKLGVHVSADAKVDIPKSKKMSVYRVSQKKIDQSLVDKINKELFSGDKTYDGCTEDMDTKESIEKEMQEIKKILADYKSGKEDAELKAEYEKELKELQKKYDRAPKTIDKNKYVSDMKIAKVGNLYNKDKDNAYYEWQNSFGANNEVLYALADSKDNCKKELYVQNNKNYGNCVRFYKGKQGYVNISGVSVESTNGKLCSNDGMWKVGSKPTEYDFNVASPDGSSIVDKLYELKNEPCTSSEKDAKATADNFLKKIGLEGYACDEQQQYYELVPDESEEKYGYRKVWFFRYLRSLDNILVNNQNGSKYSDEGSGKSFSKKMWPGESIEICVNDEGIVTFNYNVPIKINQTVVENSKLKTFEQAKKVFEKMVVTINAVDDAAGETKDISINKVVLRYMRISEKDSFDTGLLVPVWDFIGSYDNYNKGFSAYFKDVSILTVNAIDGTVIDKELGY